MLVGLLRYKVFLFYYPHFIIAILVSPKGKKKKKYSRKKKWTRRHWPRCGERRHSDGSPTPIWINQSLGPPHANIFPTCWGWTENAYHFSFWFLFVAVGGRSGRKKRSKED